MIKILIPIDALAATYIQRRPPRKEQSNERERQIRFARQVSLAFKANTAGVRSRGAKVGRRIGRERKKKRKKKAKRSSSSREGEKKLDARSGFPKKFSPLIPDVISECRRGRAPHRHRRIISMRIMPRASS